MSNEPTPDAKSGLHPAVKGGAAISIATLIALATPTLTNVYREEGGYTNSKRDPGGATKYGVTESVARAAGYRGPMQALPKHCDGPSTACADAIYVRDYIMKPGFAPLFQIEPAIGHKLVDMSVNLGTGFPQMWFRAAMVAEVGSRLVSMNDTRSRGPLNIHDIANYQAAQAKLGARLACTATLDALDAAQGARYRMLVRRNPALKIYLKGWLGQRVGNVKHSECSKGT